MVARLTSDHALGQATIHDGNAVPRSEPAAHGHRPAMSTVAIIGAGQGPGAAVARRFGKEGFSVALI